jgi:glycosyltransferase involved in cell wall biosynthesis
VAITSYEFVGLVRNGGIGTACTELGRLLAEGGHEVDLIFTGWGDDPSEEGFERCRRHYRELGLNLWRLDLEATVPNGDSVLYNASYSLALYRLLKRLDGERPYDVIHFVESLGHGFYSLLAKRQGLAFADATTVVGTHSPRRWLAAAHGMPFDHPIELGDEFMERRSLELADVALSPSAHMLDWLRDRGVQLPARSYVQQYASSHQDPSEEHAAEPITELVFFGRLEPRKGVLIFCEALDLLSKHEPAGLRRVTFLGRESVSAEYLHQRAAEWPWECTVLSDLERDAALSYLGGSGRLAVIASTMDNSPNTVYESIALGVSFLASRSGGTAEVVHPDDLDRVTYDPRDAELREIDAADPARMRPVHSGKVLAARLRRALREGTGSARFAVSPAVSREVQLAWHGGAASASAPERDREPEPVQLTGPVRITELAEADWAGSVLLVDEDVELEPGAAETLAACAATAPDAAFVTALGSFPVEGLPPSAPEREFLPTGGPAATGLLGNCAGAGVVLARADALARLGAQEGGDLAPLGVAELLSRAALAGERIDVVPERLFRLPASSVPHGTLAFLQDPLELIRPYHLSLPEESRDIAGLASRLWRDSQVQRAEAAQKDGQLAELSGQLHSLLTSRSMRVTAPMRRLGAAARRWSRGF